MAIYYLQVFSDSHCFDFFDNHKSRVLQPGNRWNRAPCCGQKIVCSWCGADGPMILLVDDMYTTGIDIS